MCFASASDRENDLSHSVQYCELVSIGMNRATARDVPGRGQLNGFSPVWDRRCEMRANRDVWEIPLREHEDHSQ